MLVLAQISDLHLDGTDRATARATQVMDYLRGLPIDAVLVTGDVADHGHPAEYQEAARILTAPFPVLTCPGNHDDRATYQKELLGEPVTPGPVNRAHRVAGTAVLMCDSTIPGREQGRLDGQTLEWLAATLDDLGDAPALVAFHHPPVALHHPLPDAGTLRPGAGLADLLASHPNVVAVLTGHAHTAAASTFAGRPVLVGPAVTWTLRLPWEGPEPADRAQPPGLAFHVLDGGDRLATHFRQLTGA